MWKQDPLMDDLLKVSHDDVEAASELIGQLPENFGTELIDGFEYKSDFQRTFLRNQIEQHATAYLARKHRAARSLPRSGAKEKLQKLDGRLGVILETLSTLSVEQSVELAGLMGRLGELDPAGTLEQARTTLESLRSAAAKMSARVGKSGPKARLNLELTVACLMLAIEVATGKRPTASFFRDGYDPRPTSPEAEALVRLVMTMDRSLRKVSVVGKIANIGSQYEGEKLREFSELMLCPIIKRVPRRW